MPAAETSVRHLELWLHLSFAARDAASDLPWRRPRRVSYVRISARPGRLAMQVDDHGVGPPIVQRARPALILHGRSHARSVAPARRRRERPDRPRSTLVSL
jgi:hypothetical protein